MNRTPFRFCHPSTVVGGKELRLVTHFLSSNLGVGVFETCGILVARLVLTLRNCDLNNVGASILETDPNWVLSLSPRVGVND